MKILVAAGGLSPERDVSLASGALIANALLDNGHQVALADIYSAVPCSGDGTPSADLFFRKDSGKRFSYTIAQQQPDIEALIRANGGRRDQVGPGFLALCRQADIVFVALHGGIGENGGFQALMPALGYLLGYQFRDKITAIDHWIAFILLGIIGANMIKEACSGDCEKEDDSLDIRTMFLLAVATSIDALAVGITFAFLDVHIIAAVSFIGVTTFVISAIGVKIGNVFGTKYKSKAEFAGGAILILLGVKILLEHLGIL